MYVFKRCFPDRGVVGLYEPCLAAPQKIIIIIIIIIDSDSYKQRL